MTCAVKCNFIANYETSYIRFFDYLQALRSVNNICRAEFIKGASVINWNTDFLDCSNLDEAHDFDETSLSQGADF